MELIPIKIDHGEEKAWGLVCGLPRAEVCRATGAAFDERAGAYRLHCYGRDFHVNPCDMLISCPTADGALFLGKLKDFFRLAVLWYMSNASRKKSLSLPRKSSPSRVGQEISISQGLKIGRASCRERV